MLGAAASADGCCSACTALDTNCVKQRAYTPVMIRPMIDTSTSTHAAVFSASVVEGFFLTLTSDCNWRSRTLR